MARLFAFFLFLPTFGLSTWAQETPYLELGPMAGHVGPHQASFWIKASGKSKARICYSESRQMTEPSHGTENYLDAATDFAAKLRISGLKPKTRYFYTIELDGQSALSFPYPSFTTAPEVGDANRTRFAFVSCVGKEGHESAGAWGEMESQAEIDLLLMLGDNHYADSTSAIPQREAYYRHRSYPTFRALTSRTPTYGIWDDHDFGPNNSDGTAKGKFESLRTFQSFWPNPSFGESGNPGIYFQFSRGDIDFFMLDGRFYRTPNKAEDKGNKTILGRRQMEWLKEGLKNSKAKLKFVACGSEFQRNGSIDSWTQFKREQDEFFDLIKDEKIEGVILLSGDRHFTGGYHVDGRVIEITSGPLGSGNFGRGPVPEMFLNIRKGKLYCVFDVNTAKSPPEVVLEVHRPGDGIIDKRDFTWDEINGRSRLALLPVVPKKERPKDLLFTEDFSKGASHWEPTDTKAWRVMEQDGNPVYSLHRQSRYKPPHRSPFNISLIKDLVVSDFVLEARVLTTQRDYGHRSMCLFFGYQDPSHFYYVHLGQKADKHANQVFIVDGKPRTKISETTTDGTPWDAHWHDVKIVREVKSGKIEVYWDDMEKPVMTATDKAFQWGRVGLGSFDDTGNWDDVRVSGVKVKKP